VTPRYLFRILSALGVALTLMVALSSPAAAAPEDESREETAGLAAKSAAGDKPIRLAIVSGCVGNTHNPHRSYSFASVHGDTGCPFATSMIVSINLYRWRWYGKDHLANGYREGYTSYVNGNAKWYCSGVGTYTYRGESYHRAYVNGQAHVAYTANEERFSC